MPSPPRDEALPTPTAIELNIRRDPTIYDGQFANNGWLQELPKPMSKLTWDNAVMIGPKMAERLQARSKDCRRLELERQEDQRRGLDSGRASR